MSQPQGTFGLERRNDQGFLRSTAKKGSGATFKVRGVEGWRGVAALAVVAVHAWQVMDTDGDGLGPYSREWVAQAWMSVDLAVDLFFVLSGLLLFLPFVSAALDDERPVPAGDDFLWRRCFRFLPTYWLLVVFCWSLRNYGVLTADWLDLVEHILLVQSFDSDRIFATIGPAWTLSVDWMFYVALALIAPSWTRWVREVPSQGRRLVRLLGPVLALGVASMLYKLNVDFVWHLPFDAFAWRFGPAAKADTFAVGMLAAVFMVWMRGRRLPISVSAGLVVAGFWLLYASRVTTRFEPQTVTESLRHTTGALGWTLVLVAIMACRSDRPARIIDSPPLLRISVVAFTVYLVHEPVALGFESWGWIRHDDGGWAWNFTLIASVALGLAWVLHRVVEEPFVDVGALRPKGGGRRDLYAEIELPRLPAAAATPLRDRALRGAPTRSTFQAVEVPTR